MSSALALAAYRWRAVAFAGIAVAVLAALAFVFWPRPGPARATEVATIDAGAYHTCVVTDVGSARCWGSNGSGEVGDGTTTAFRPPVDVISLSTGAAAVATGTDHSCAITTVGGVKCWGANGSGQLGDVSGEVCGPFFPFLYPCSRIPLDVAGLGGPVAALAAGGDHTCALTASGGVKCWGANTYGQLGNGTTTSSMTPVDVTGLTDGVAAIAAGHSHSCALTAGGGMKCWGSNAYGKLGVATAELCDFFVHPCSTTPLDVGGLTSNVADITAGSAHTCAVTVGGGAKCWGRNASGQVGSGTTTTSGCECLPTPVDVVGLASGVARIDAGVWHTCATTTAGGVKCWGDNAYGQLGNGTTSSSTTPVDVLNLSAVVGKVAAGSTHTCALAATGSVKCWGDGTGGGFGYISTTPVDIAGAKPLPTATPCEPQPCTPTATRTRRPTATPTRTPTAFPTSTPCPPDACAEMSLNVTSPAGQCDHPSKPTKCTLPIGTTFSLSIAVNSPPTAGYIGFQTQIFYHSLTYNQTVLPEVEIVWPDSGLPVRNENPGTVDHGALTSIGDPFPVSSYRGTIVQLNMTCTLAPHSTEIVLGAVSESNLLGSAFAVTGGPLVPLPIVGQRSEDIDVTPPNEQIPIADALRINCVAPPAPTPTYTPTPTATPLPVPRVQKLPPLQNLFLTRQGTQIPPLRCVDGTDVATLTESISIPISGMDPKNPPQTQQLGGFSFQVKYDPLKVCVTLRPGAAWTVNPQQVCTVQDSVTAPTLQGIARMNCVTLGKATRVDTSTAAGRTLAIIEVRPQPEAADEAEPG